MEEGTKALLERMAETHVAIGFDLDPDSDTPTVVNVAILGEPGDFVSVMRNAAADIEHEHIVVIRARDSQPEQPLDDWLPFERCLRYGMSAAAARWGPGYGQMPSLGRRLERIDALMDRM